MIICGFFTFAISVSKDMKKKTSDKRRISAYVLAYILALIVIKFEN